MKRIFFVAAIAALALVSSCTKEKPIDGTDPEAKGLADGSMTYATFNFRFSSGPVGGKSIAQPVGLATGDDVINNVRLLVFRNTTASTLCEVNDYISSSDGEWTTSTTTSANQSRTVLVSSGPKKIFVITGVSDASSGVKTRLNNKLNSVIVDGTTLAQFYTLMQEFQIGADGVITDYPYPVTPPNVPDVATFDAATFEQATFGGLKELITNDYVLSSAADASAAKTLIGGVTKEDSRDNEGDASKNNFIFNVYRTVARVKVSYASATALTTTDELGKLSSVAGDLKYGMRNLNRQVNIFPWFGNDNLAPGAWPQAPFYNTFAGWSVANKEYKENFRGFYYNGYLVDQNVTEKNSPAWTAAPFVIVTENTNATPLIGNSTYARIDAIFLPAAGKVITGFTYDNVNQRFGTGANAATVSASDITTPQTFYKLKVENANTTSGGASYAANLPAVLFTDKELAYKAAFCIEHGTDVGFVYGGGSGYVPSSTYLVEYTGGACYYRLNIGEDVMVGAVKVGVKYGVQRNYSYSANITAFNTLGVSDPGELEDGPEIEIGEMTHVTAVINVVVWTEVNQNEPV